VFTLSEPQWIDELGWIESMKSFDSFEFTFADLKAVIQNPMLLPSKIIHRRFKHLVDNRHMQDKLEAVRCMGKRMINSKIIATFDYLSEGYSTDNPQSLLESLCDIQTLLRYELFHEAWKIFTRSPPLQQMESEQFFNDASITIWNKMTKENNLGLLILFHMNMSCSEVLNTKEHYYSNIIQRSMILLNNGDNPMVQALFAALSIDIPVDSSQPTTESRMDGFYALTRRIILWTRKLRGKTNLDRTDGGTFASLLSACVRDVAFRGFIAVFIPSDSILNDFCKSHGFPLVEQGCDRSEQLVEFIFNNIIKESWKPNRIFLTILGLPLLLDMVSLSEKQPQWHEENEWLTSILASKKTTMLTWTEINDIFVEEPKRCWEIMLKGIEVQDRNGKLDQLFKLTVQNKNFEWREIINSLRYEHFFDHFFDCNAQTSLQGFVLNDTMFRDLVRFALTNSQYPKFKTITAMLHMLIPSNDGSGNSAHKTYINTVSNLSMIVVDELYSAIKHNNICKDRGSICDILSCLFTLENLENNTLISLSRLESSKRVS
jgi:hypothetical protein